MPHVSGAIFSQQVASCPPANSESKEKVGTPMYAIIETGGKQYKVQNGDTLFIEKLDAAEEASVTFDKVIALHDDAALKVGAPYVEGASVTAHVLKNGKGKKITVFTYKPKKGCARKLGHRQPYTKVQIDTINA
jgi:large subunit ribosomal protein L21